MTGNMVTEHAPLLQKKASKAALDSTSSQLPKTTPDHGTFGAASSQGTIQNGASTPQEDVSSMGATTTTINPSWLTRKIGPPNTIKILLAGLFISFSFSLTQVPLFYVFYLMQCDAYYSSHAPYTGPGDKCAINEIAAGTATQYSILAMSTTFCGTINLFVTGWTVKKWGPRFALALQTFIPAIRVLLQILGVVAGGSMGIGIIQSTQLITILGGPAGYILVVNTIAGYVVEPALRTAVFGQLQGCTMLGMAVGFLLGGVIGDEFGVRMPFQVACLLLLSSCLYASTVLPYISPESLTEGKKAKETVGGIGAFFAPLKIMAPQRIRIASGQVRKHYGIFYLSCGCFLAVLATGFVPLLLQMYATAFFEFTQADNGWLMSGNALVRSLFLFFVFPKIIEFGRAWWISRSKEQAKPVSVAKGTRAADDSSHQLPDALEQASDPRDIEVPTMAQAEEPAELKDVESDQESVAGSQFDLFFLRWSMLLDGVLTAAAALCTQRWHIYLAAFILPFGSGTAPAAKGVITMMCPKYQRADALNAITLVENVARLSTVALFGAVYAALAEVGRADLTFYCNAGIAVIGMGVLYLSHFPPEGSVMEEDLLEDNVDSTDR